MPEEINRLLTDQIADLLFTPSQDGDENLLREGVDREKVHFVGNVMIDTLMRLLPSGEELWSKLSSGFGLAEKEYGLVTLHRPSNVDEPSALSNILTTLDDMSNRLPILFPIHPRTRARIEQTGIDIKPNGCLRLTDPLGYLEFLCLQQRAKMVITDSGGIQEETTFLGVPCLTVRENTERPVTVSIGTNILVGQDMSRLRYEADRILGNGGKQGVIPPLWDGKAGERIAAAVAP